MKKIITYIKNHKVLFIICKPVGDFLQGIVTLVIRIKKFCIFRVFPFVRNILGRRKTQDLLKFKNIHKGKRIFVIATGPSLREEDILKIKNEITIGVNGLITLYKKIGWKPQYLCLTDPVGYNLYGQMINDAEMKDVFMGLELWKFQSKMNFKPHFYDGFIKGMLEGISVENLRKNMYFSEDIFLEGIYKGGWSITTHAVQLAAYMGAKEIILYGLDCDYYGNRSHFHEEQSDGLPVGTKDIMINAMFAFFEKAKEFAEIHDIKIINATRGGKLEIFERMDLDDILWDKK